MGRCRGQENGFTDTRANRLYSATRWTKPAQRGSSGFPSGWQEDTLALIPRRRFTGPTVRLAATMSLSLYCHCIPVPAELVHAWAAARQVTQSVD